MKTIKVKASDVKTQGEFIVINEVDFDADVHEKYEEKAKPAKKASTSAPKKAEDEDI
jgi:hypothetical protein